MKISKQWNNWKVFLAGVIFALIITFFLEPYYRQIFNVHSGNWIFPVEFDTYPSTFLFLYTLFFTFFYKAFGKEFKIKKLIFFIALPFLLYISSLPHFLIFAGLLAAGLALGHLVRRFAQ